MTPINTIYSEMGIRETVLSFGNTIEKDLKNVLKKIDKIAEYNQLKVVKAMQDNRVSAGCFNYASVMVMMTREEIPSKKYMHLFSIPKALWCVRRSLAEHMHWHWLLQQT